MSGSSFARVKPKDQCDGRSKVLLAGHIDEIGFVITHIDKEGFLWFFLLADGTTRSSLDSDSALRDETETS